MAKKNVVYSVKNVSAGVVIYKIPEINIRREFMAGETKSGISFEELEKLTYQAGGRELLANYLQIVDKKVLQDLGVTTEPEYFYTEEKIMNIMKNGTLDEFLDLLDFAPIGRLDLIKKFAVSLPLTDTVKIEHILKKTGFDVSKAIRMDKADKAVEQTVAPAKGNRRRVAIEEDAAPAPETKQRRTYTKLEEN
jgi:hypothetical protein